MYRALFSQLPCLSLSVLCKSNDTEALFCLIDQNCKSNVQLFCWKMWLDLIIWQWVHLVLLRITKKKNDTALPQVVSVVPKHECLLF